MHTGRYQDKSEQPIVTSIDDEIEEKTYLLSEDPILDHALVLSFREIKSEVDSGQYIVPKSIHSQKFSQFLIFDDKAHSYLATKNITVLHPFYLFYMSQMNKHNKILDPTMYMVNMLFKTFNQSQTPASLYVSSTGHHFISVFNSPVLKIKNKYTIEDLNFASKVQKNKNILIVTNRFQFFYSFDDFAKACLSEENYVENFMLLYHFKSELIKNFANESKRLQLDAKEFYNELMKQTEFEKTCKAILQSQNNFNSPLDKKTKSIKMVSENPKLNLTDEIRLYEKFSPIARHKSFIGLKKDVIISNISTEQSIHEYEILLNNYVQKSITAFLKNDSLDPGDSSEIHTIKEFQIRYDALITKEATEEVKTIIKELKNIMHEFNPLFKKSLEQLQTNILEIQQITASEFKIAQNQFYTLHKNYSEKLTLLKKLHKEAEIKQNKKLKQVVIFTKTQSLAKYLGQLSYLKKLVDKSSEKDIATVKTHTLTLEKDFKGIDDKIQTLHKILQPQERRSKQRKPNIAIKSEIVETKQQVPTLPTQNHTVEDFDLDFDSNKNSAKNKKKKNKSKPKIISEQSVMPPTSLTDAITVELNVIPPLSETITQPKEIPYYAPSIIEESKVIDLVTTSIIAPVDKPMAKLTSDSFSINMLNGMTALIEKDSPISLLAPETTSLLKHHSMFKSNMLLSPDESKIIPSDFTAYSYGLLVRCKNNSSLSPFAQRITKIIKTFSPNRELSSQPHISLFYVEDLQLNNATMREKINIDLQELFSKMPLPSTLHLTSVGVYGVGHNDNKFLALEIKVDEQLNDIYEACLGVFKKHGISIQKKYDFKPHITLGYSKVALCQSQLNTINPVITKSYVELDVAVFNRKPPPKKGVPNYQIKLEELQTFKLNTGDRQILRVRA